MKPNARLLVTLLFPYYAALGGGLVWGTEAVAQSAPEKPAASPAPRTADEKLIRAEADRFGEAFNAGDSKRVADLFTDDAEMIDEHGDRIQGRDHIREVFSTLFKDRAGVKITTFVDSVRFLGSDAAKEDGRSRLVFPGTEPAINRRYTVLYVKQDGRWLHSSVREELDPTNTPHDRLKELEWMNGDWIDESADSTVTARCRWSDDQNFLLRDFEVFVQGKLSMRVSQRIGWDPLTKQIKSWVFDSEGGHGEGSWSREGNSWIIKATGVLPDGRIASGTHEITRINPTTARWISRDRTVAGQIFPEHEEYVLVRKPPVPKAR